MGKGNVGVAGAYEGLFYIDNEDFHVYRRNDDLDDWPETRLMRDLDYAELTGDGWLFDEEGTANEEDDVLECFKDDFCRRFPSCQRTEPDTWIRNGAYGNLCRQVILENGLFYVCVEDNEWSLAVELIQKEEMLSLLHISMCIRDRIVFLSGKSGMGQYWKESGGCWKDWRLTDSDIQKQ